MAGNDAASERRGSSASAGVRERSRDFVAESGNIVGETAARIFADLADPQTVNRAANGAWREPLWQALSEAGLTLAWVPEAHGGAGASLADGFEILTVAGRFAAPVPLAETLLAGWLLARAGVSAPAGAMTVAPARPGEREDTYYREVIIELVDGTELPLNLRVDVFIHPPAVSRP